MVSVAQPVANVPAPKKKQPYPFYLGGVAATIAASVTHPLDLTKVRLQASGDKRMIQSMKKTVRTAGFRGLYDGITGTWLRQMSYSLCRFWAYDESKKILGANPQSPAWVLATAGAMGTLCATTSYVVYISNLTLIAGSIAGIVGNPGGMSSLSSFMRPHAHYRPPEVIMVCCCPLVQYHMPTMHCFPPLSLSRDCFPMSGSPPR